MNRLKIALIGSTALNLALLATAISYTKISASWNSLNPTKAYSKAFAAATESCANVASSKVDCSHIELYELKILDNGKKQWSFGFYSDNKSTNLRWSSIISVDTNTNQVIQVMPDITKCTKLEDSVCQV